MKDLSSIIKKTPQSIHSLIKNNQELESIIKQHTERKGRNVFYDEVVLEWLRAYYGVETATEEPQAAASGDTENPTANDVAAGVVEPEEEAIPEPTAPDDRDAVIARQEEQITFLQGQVVELSKDKAYLREENARLLLLLQQEKDEKKLFLPAPRGPRKPIGERIRGLFGAKKGAE
jgi:hypothetical protein